MTRPERMLPATSIARHSSRKLIDHRQALQLLAVGTGIEHEVVGPDLARGRCRQRAAGDWPPHAAVASFSALAAHAAARADALDRRSSHGPGAPGTPGCADSRSADTAPRARASPPPPAHRASPVATLAHCRSSHAQQRARSSDRSASLAYVGDLSADERARSPFFCGDFLQDLDVHDSLGQTFLSRAFSASSCRSRFTSTASSCPKRLRQA